MNNFIKITINGSEQTLDRAENIQLYIDSACSGDILVFEIIEMTEDEYRAINNDKYTHSFFK